MCEDLRVTQRSAADSSAPDPQTDGVTFGERVQVRLDGDDVVVTDTAHPSSPVLRYDKDEWRAFVAGVKAGEFDV
jgi:Domain of unknown function (DUF397)